MHFKCCLYLTIAILSAFKVGGLTARAETYPWCTQGDALHCYYMNHQQCEESVDYHGFCVTNPDYRQGRT